jgi:hypothetical protein
MSGLVPAPARLGRSGTTGWERHYPSSSVETRSIESDLVAGTPWSTDVMCRAVLHENVETEV